MNPNTKKLVVSSLFAAFTCVATMIIKFPTPTFGYIHLGDSLVLLCGIVLGPVLGGLSAGIGSMFSDLFSGYVSFAPATLIIKALTAACSGFIYHKLKFHFTSHNGRSLRILIGGIFGELIMIFGYFAYETSLAALATGEFTKAALAAGIASSAAGIPFNIVQGISGIVIAILLTPVLLKVNDIRDWILN